MMRVGELKMEIRMTRPGLAVCTVTSVEKDARMLLKDQRAYFEKYSAQIRAAGDIRWMDIIINSTGGAMSSAMGMCYAIQQSGIPAGQVLIQGFCGSAATLIAFGTAGKVFITPESHVYIHMPVRKIATRKDGKWTISERIAQASTTGVLLTAYRGKTHRRRYELRKWMEEGKRMTAQEAVELGFCDRIVTRAEFEKGT